MKLTDKEVLQLVDGICLGFEDGDKKNPEYCINEIFMAVHSHRAISCYSSHDDWRKQAVKNLKVYKKHGMC